MPLTTDIAMKQVQSDHVTIDAMGSDVGFFSTKFTLGRSGEDNAIVVDRFPSMASRVNAVGGKLPLSRSLDGFKVTVAGVPHFVGKDVMHTLQAHGSRAVIDDYSSSSDYRSLFLGTLAYAARHFGAGKSLTIKQLVVGLPLSTVYTHSRALKQLVESDHMVPHLDESREVRVTVRHATVVAQPQGALINFGSHKSSDETRKISTLVLDMGGGTFDWFVSMGIHPNHARCGAAPIGMLKCATAVCDMINPQLRDDPLILQRVDDALRNGDPTFTITGRSYDTGAYMAAVDAVLNDAIDQMLKRVGSLHNIDQILLTGGGAKVLTRVVKARLAEFAHMVKVDPDPVASNVRGFHVLAELLNT